MTIRTSILLEMSVLDLKDKKKKKEGLDFTSDVNLDICDLLFSDIDLFNKMYFHAWFMLENVHIF